MNYVIFDDEKCVSFLPLTYTRPLGKLIWGVFSLEEKWEKTIGQPVSWLTFADLQPAFPVVVAEDNILLNARIDPDEELLAEIQRLTIGQQLVYQDLVIAERLDENTLRKRVESYPQHHRSEWRVPLAPGRVETKKKPFFLEEVTDLYTKNDSAINRDFALRIKSKADARHLDASNHIWGNELYLSKTAAVKGAFLDTTTGPIYIDDHAEVMPGAMIKGPFVLRANAVVKMGAKIYGPTTIGPFSKVGGEVSNSVIQGYSNKAHDGFLGNSLLGSWCNLGADTNTSNLKNNYSQVRLWSYEKDNYVQTKLQFCGVIMGDHSKCSINTMFNTATVVGVGANIFDAGFPPKFLPSFTWGGKGNWTTYEFNKSLEVAATVMARRKMELNKAQIAVLTSIFERTANYRETFAKR